MNCAKTTVDNNQLPTTHNSMKNTLLKRSLLSTSITLAIAIGSIGLVPQAKAAAGDSRLYQDCALVSGAIATARRLGRVPSRYTGTSPARHLDVIVAGWCRS
jgi:hypothetical protein